MDKDELRKLIHEIMDEKMCEYKKHESDKPATTVEDKVMQSADGDNEGDMESDEAEKEKLKNERDASRRAFSRLENENKVMMNRLVELENKANLAQRKSDLISIEGEGYVFDMNDELDYVKDLDAKAYEKHLNKIRKNYSKAPVHSLRLPVKEQAPHGATKGEQLISGDEEVATRSMTLATEKLVQQAQGLVLSGKAKNFDDAMNQVRSK